MVPSSNIVGEASKLISRVDLIAFMPTEGEEVPDFNTIFYDKEKRELSNKQKRR